MEFVADLREAEDVFEIAVDGLGRAELLNGRVRLTFYREVTRPDGSVYRSPCGCVVCTVPVWLQMRATGPRIVRMLDDAASAGATPLEMQPSIYVH